METHRNIFKDFASAVTLLSRRLSERQPLERRCDLSPELLQQAFPLSCVLSFWHCFRKTRYFPGADALHSVTWLSSTCDIRGDFPQQKHVYLAEQPPLSLPSRPACLGCVLQWGDILSALPESLGVPDTLVGLFCGLPLAWSVIVCQVWLPIIYLRWPTQLSRAAPWQPLGALSFPFKIRD